MISLDNLSIVLALSSIGLSLHVLRAVGNLPFDVKNFTQSSIGLSLHVLRAIWQLWRAGGVR